MPAMSASESRCCGSLPWRLVSGRVVLPWALQRTPLRGRVLEIGAGSGVMARRIARAYPEARVVATDVDPAMARRGKGRVVVADATRLPFPDGAFDVVLSFLMLHHVVRWEDALAEARRVLRRGGVLVGYDVLDRPLNRALHRLDGSRIRLLDRDELAPALAAARFEAHALRVGGLGHVVRFVAVARR